MIGKNLAFYFSRSFYLNILGVFLACFCLVLVVDFLEMMRKIGDKVEISSLAIFLLAFTRVPFFVELILPFAVLIGSIICFINFSRKLEFVVARAAGVSAWQFLSPAIVGAFLIGVFTITVYNPMAVNLREYGVNKEIELLKGKQAISTQRFWMRQQSDIGQDVISAANGSKQGQILSVVNFFRFDEKGKFFQRIDSQTAELHEGFWRFHSATQTELNQPSLLQNHIDVKTNLTKSQVRDNFTSPDMVAFWDLQNFIALSKQAGLPATRFELQYQVLLAKPFLLIAMVLLAASASLKFFRLGGVGKTILTGITIGFMLYIGSELANNLGRSGFMPPVMAAWLPATVGCLVGIWLLLKQEDG